MVGGQDGPTPLVCHEPRWNKYYQYIIYSISFMNSSSDFIVQSATVGVKNAKIYPSHTLPWMSDPSTIIVKGMGSTTTTVSGKNALA